MNSDYIFLVESGMLLVMAMGAASLARLQRAMPWNALTWFAAARALLAFVNLVTVVVPTHPAFPFLKLAGVVASCAFILEFAARSTPRIPDHRALRYLVFTLLITAVLAVGWKYGPITAAWTAFGCNLAATGWAAFFVDRLGRKQIDRRPRQRLRLAAALLIGDAAIAGIPDPSFWPKSWVFRSDGLAISGAILATLLSVIVYLHSAAEQQKRMPAAASRAWRRRRYVCASIICFVLGISWWTADRQAREKDQSMREQILFRAKIAAASIDHTLVTDLQWGDADLPTESYLRLKQLMMSLQHANQDLRFALLAGMNGGASYFLVDSERPESVDYSPPGQLYAEADPAYLAAMRTGEPFVLGPVTDRWGIWVIGSVPLLRLANGRTVNFELDVAATHWDAEVRQTRIPAVVVGLLICILIVGFFRMQERLRESALLATLSEQRSRSLVEGSPDCVQMFDLEGRFLAVNRNGLEAMGRPTSNVIGRKFWEIWPLAAQPAIREAIERTSRGEAMSFDAEYIRPDRRRITWRVATNPITDDAGQVCNIVGICVDLTARKIEEAALRAAKDAAEAATRAKSEFLAVMSHELRTPLAGVIGMLDLLRHSPAEPLRRRYTHVARETAETLLRILDDILDTAKIEAGRLTLELIPFRSRTEFRHLTEAARLRAEAKGLDFECRVDSSVPEVIVGDPTRLRQVIGNLQNNAIKFTERGQISVSIAAVPLNEASVQLTIAVRDSGIGILPEHLGRVFSKFEQGDLSTTRRFGGTGLGLSIVKALTEAMGGSVSVTSEAGKGSTFTFTAPFGIGASRDVPLESEAGPADLPPPAIVLRILAAEDDAVNSMVAEAIITRLGHTVDFVENGRLALERLRTHRYDLVLMDNRMPVMDGLQASQTIRSGTSGVLDPEIYICAATANVSDADRARCRDHGMNDYVKKPIAERELADAFARAIADLERRGKVPMNSVERAEPNEIGRSEADLLAEFDEEVNAQKAEASGAFAPDTLTQLRELFWQQAPGRMIAIRLAADEQNHIALGNEAHALKSAAHYVGAHELSALVAELERLSSEGPVSAITETLEKAEIEYIRFQRAMPQTVP